MEINIKSTLLLLLSSAFTLSLVDCGGTGAPSVGLEATVEARVAEERAAEPKAAATNKGSVLDPAMKEELLALANERDAWFLASDITTEALEGLYGSWSVICRNKTSLSAYKGAVYEDLRPWLLEMLRMELKDAQRANRYYDVVSWSSPWAYVEQTWKLGDKIILGPERQLYLMESGAWRYHDC